MNHHSHACVHACCVVSAAFSLRFLLHQVFADDSYCPYVWGNDTNIKCHAKVALAVYKFGGSICYTKITSHFWCTLSIATDAILTSHISTTPLLLGSLGQVHCMSSQYRYSSLPLTWLALGIGSNCSIRERNIEKVARKQKMHTTFLSDFWIFLELHKVVSLIFLYTHHSSYS